IELGTASLDQLIDLMAAVTGPVAGALAAIDVVPVTRVAGRDLRELGNVEVAGWDARRAEDDVRRQRMIIDLDADRLHLCLCNRLRGCTDRVTRRPGPVDRRGQARTLPDLRVARIDRGRPAGAVLRHEGESLLRVEVPFREVRLIRRLGLVVDRTDDRLAIDRHRKRLTEPRRAKQLIRRASGHTVRGRSVAFAELKMLEEIAGNLVERDPRRAL